jgi:transposase
VPRPLPVELRERIVRAVEEDGLTHAEVARTFRVGPATVARYLRRWREGHLEPTEQRRGRLPLISAEGLEEVRALLEERPDDTTQEVAPSEHRSQTSSRPALRRD